MRSLNCSSAVANKLLDLLVCSDVSETDGLNKLHLFAFRQACEPFEDEVLTRLSHSCFRISHLELEGMNGLTEAGRLSMAGFFRQII